MLAIRVVQCLIHAGNLKYSDRVTTFGETRRASMASAQEHIPPPQVARCPASALRRYCVGGGEVNHADRGLHYRLSGTKQERAILLRWRCGASLIHEISVLVDALPAQQHTRTDVALISPPIKKLRCHDELGWIPQQRAQHPTLPRSWS